MRSKKIIVRRTTFEEEQRMKDEAFLKLTPEHRFRIHEQMRKKIWGEKYNKQSLIGLKVIKKSLS